MFVVKNLAAAYWCARSIVTIRNNDSNSYIEIDPGREYH